LAQGLSDQGLYHMERGQEPFSVSDARQPLGTTGSPTLSTASGADVALVIVERRST
jgi:hypothetical protein